MANELILIIEDDPNSRKLARDVLQAKGYQTIESENAERGLVLAAEQLPALVLMDIQLPGMNGIEALKALRASAATSSIPVIAVTASVMNKQQGEIMGAGFNAVERKPISVAGLLQKIRELLDRTPARSSPGDSPP
jgi:two-component system, cell cycle response regulator DivK